jgi:hypothetical protein
MQQTLIMVESSESNTVAVVHARDEGLTLSIGLRSSIYVWQSKAWDYKLHQLRPLQIYG